MVEMCPASAHGPKAGDASPASPAHNLRAPLWLEKKKMIQKLRIGWIEVWLAVRPHGPHKDVGSE